VNADASIKSSDQYKSFDKSKLQHATVQGGDTKFLADLQKEPPEADKFQEWTATALTNPDVTNFSTIELWAIMANALNDTIVNYAQEIESAFNWLVNHPQQYQTQVTFNIESDWGEFGLLTPSAAIVDPKDVETKDSDKNIFATDLKIMWGKEHSHVENRFTVEYVFPSFLYTALALFSRPQYLQLYNYQRRFPYRLLYLSRQRWQHRRPRKCTHYYSRGKLDLRLLILACLTGLNLRCID
jgi:hypothetical protein